MLPEVLGLRLGCRCGTGEPGFEVVAPLSEDAFPHYLADPVIVDSPSEGVLDLGDWERVRVVAGDVAEGFGDEETVPDGVQVWFSGSERCG